MSKLDDMAMKVASNYPSKNGEAALDPSMIPVIIEVIGNLVTLFKQCNKTPGEALKSSKNPSRWEKIALNTAVRRQVGFRQFRREGDELVAALMSSAATTTEKDIKELYDEVD